jgi:hypothetical protein
MKPRGGFLYSFEVFRFAEGMGISLGMSLSDYVWPVSISTHLMAGTICG